MSHTSRSAICRSALRDFIIAVVILVGMITVVTLLLASRCTPPAPESPSNGFYQPRAYTNPPGWEEPAMEEVIEVKAIRENGYIPLGMQGDASPIIILPFQ